MFSEIRQSGFCNIYQERFRVDNLVRGRAGDLRAGPVCSDCVCACENALSELTHLPVHVRREMPGCQEMRLGDGLIMAVDPSEISALTPLTRDSG